MLSGAVNVALGIWLIVAPRVRRRHFAAMNLRWIIRRATIILLASLLCQLLGAQILAESLTNMLRHWGAISENATIGPALPLICYLALTHTAMSVIIPWNVWEAARPILLILGVLLVCDIFLFKGDSFNMQVLGLVLTFAAGVPGTAIAALRYSKLRDWVQIRFLATRQEEMERELSVARRIHERLFPAPGDYRGVSIAYAYEPMRQIGGDYLHCYAEPGGGVLIVVVDVTGHGIGSALAVNRLHGEIKRALALNETDPARLLHTLNEYIAATLADETVFATAMAARISPDRRTLTWCNAGHPPAMLLRADGSVQRLETSAMMLGVATWEGDGAGTPTQIHPGDVLILYTDGAVEAADDQGRQFGIDAVEATLRARRGASAAMLVAAVNDAVRAHLSGPPQDDLLVVAVRAEAPHAA